MQELIEKINALAKKQREEGLSEEEAALQKELREKYLANIRASFTGHIESIVIKNPDGSMVHVKDLKKK